MAHTPPATTDEDPTSALTIDFSQTARSLFAAGNVEATLAHVVSIAVATIEGCDHAGIFLAEGEVVTNLVYSDPVVANIDALQQRIGEGPGLDVITYGAIVYVDDLADEPRWPNFGHEAIRAGYAACWCSPCSPTAP